VIDGVRAEGVEVQFLQLDLSSQKSVRHAAAQMKEQGTKVDVLINNAAVMACPYALTEDGIEMQFATNHLGPFLFTNLLLDAGLVTDRIVNVSSLASVRKESHLLPPLDDLSYSDGKNYDPAQAYAVSKIAMVLWTRQLAERLTARHISVFSLNPGSIKSPLQRYMTEAMREAAIAAIKRDNPDFVAPTRKTLQQGCSTQLRAALDPALVTYSGAYLDHCQIVEPPEHRDVYHAADRVWQLSEKMVNNRFDI
jgi:NAD(P)-dependent dehydrogenase (short-subunit alcohol dehydrogenase family)